MKNTWSYGESIATFLQPGTSEKDKIDEITGAINRESKSFCILETQREAWRIEVELLRQVLKPYNSDSNRIYFEFDLMRFSKRVDVVLILNGILICLEFKTDMSSGDTHKPYTTQDKLQAMGYADEFAKFHSTSHMCPIVPVLVVPAAPDVNDPVELCCENIFEVIRTNKGGLASVLKSICDEVPIKGKSLSLIEDVTEWEQGDYQTVPTIVDACGRLFENQTVEAITRSGTDVTGTMRTVEAIIRRAEKDCERVVCFVTGEPGAGKTLVGLKIASQRMERQVVRNGEDKLIRKVLLSGNYPLVNVLKASLTRNFYGRLVKCKDKLNKENRVLTQEERAFVQSSGFEVCPTGKTKRVKINGKNVTVPQFEFCTINEFSKKGKREFQVKDPNKEVFKKRKLTKHYIEATVSSMIQLVSHFRRGWETSEKAPSENVFVFDEAQRAWNADQVRAKDKKTHPDQIRRNWSEPRTLLEYLNRHGKDDWCVAICLVGSGQDIHTGEARIEEWYDALVKSKNLKKWKICGAPNTVNSEAFKKMFDASSQVNPAWDIDYESLHLHDSVRSFRSKHVGAFVNALLEGKKSLENKEDVLGAKELYAKVLNDGFPLYLTRSKDDALSWVEKMSLHGERRCGRVMSSRALRLRKYGFITQGMGFDEVSWFLDGPDVINSSCAMELAASEFKIQGLELDYVLMGWDGDFLYDSASGKFVCRLFSKNENLWKPVAKIKEEDETEDITGDDKEKERNPRDRERHLKNAYRVLLTRARQGMVIYIPEGVRGSATENNLSSENYDPTYAYLHDEVGVLDLRDIVT